jgi:hypothetical protein
MKINQTFFQTQDLQTHLTQFLSVSDLMQRYQFITKDTHAITGYPASWAALLQRDFKLDVKQLNLQDEQANYLFYKALYLETQFRFYKDANKQLQLFQKAVQALTPCLNEQSDWKQYFDLSIKLHECAPQRLSYPEPINKQQIEEAFLQLLKTKDNLVFERVCWLVANRYWIFEHYFESTLFKALTRLDSLDKQNDNDTYYVRSNMLYALHCMKVREKEREDEMCETASDDESGMTGADLYRSLYHALKNKDETFYPLVARLLLRTPLDSWTFWMSLDYKTAVKRLYEHFTEELENKPSFEDFLIDLYTELAKIYEPFRAVIFPHLHSQIEQNNCNVFYQLDYKAARKNILEVMESRPKLFSIAILSRVQEKLQSGLNLTEQEALQQKEELKSLIEKTRLYHQDEDTRSFIKSQYYDEPRQMHELLNKVGKADSSYLSDDEEAENDYGYNNPYTSFFESNILGQHQASLTMQHYKRQRYDEMMNTIINSAKKYSFNEKNAIAHINNALGATFVKNYIDTQRGQWQVEKTQGSFTAKLAGLQIAKKNDCEWYKAKLLKAGIQAKDIHFDAIQGTKGAGDKYQIRLTNLQAIKSNTPQQATSVANSAYQQFMGEMDTQIENIKTAQQLLLLEQKMMLVRGMGGCIRAIQNTTKLDKQAKLIAIFETAKSTADQTNYTAKRNEAYRKAETFGYTKTESKEEAAQAYSRRLDWA